MFLTLSRVDKESMIISNDTYATVALMYHMPVFLQHNLKELWVRTEVGDITRYLLPYLNFCAVLPTINGLTG